MSTAANNTASLYILLVWLALVWAWAIRDVLLRWQRRRRCQHVARTGHLVASVRQGTPSAH